MVEFLSTQVANGTTQQKHTNGIFQALWNIMNNQIFLVPVRDKLLSVVYVFELGCV